MAELDPTLREATPTDFEAARMDAYRMAVALMKQQGTFVEATSDDVLELARWIYNG